MAVKVLALASGVTGLADHRVLNGALLPPAGSGAVSTRAGVFITNGTAGLSTVSAMVARIAPLRAVVPNSISVTLGPYLVVSDANVDITFDAGEASVPRVDRVIIRVRDNVNDGSGSTAGSVEYLKGQASGSATALPNNSILLWEMTIPAGASAGGGGVNFANAVDLRRFITAHGGIAPVVSTTAQAAISGPYTGETIYRTDLNALDSWDGSAWRVKGQISVASSAALTNIDNPWNGLMAVARDTLNVYVYNGSTWEIAGGRTEARKGVLVRGRRTTATGNVTTTETGVLRLDSIPVFNGRSYRIMTNGINMDSSVDNDVAVCRLRTSTSGAATISSTIVSSVRNTIDSAAQSNIIPANGIFNAGADGTLSVLLSVLRVAGSGNIVVFCSATDYLDMWVEDIGPTPTDTGVVI